MLASWKKSHDKPRQYIKEQRHYFANKGAYSQSYGFSSSHVWMWELDHKEDWALKNWCFWTAVLEKTLESPLDFEIQPVHLKGDQSWVFTGKTDVEAETPNILATWCEELTHSKRPRCWERLKTEGEGENRGWDGWMASPTQWTWVGVNSRSWWRTGRPSVLWFMGSQRVWHDWETELKWTGRKEGQGSLRRCSPWCLTAKSLQSCPMLWDPIDGSPPGSPVPGILQARALEWVAISFSNAWKWKVKVKSLSRVGPSATPWTAAFQAPPSMGFSRQEYWSGVPLPSPMGSEGLNNNFHGSHKWLP